MPAEQKENSKRVYFPNLNGLRFIAALLVIVHHVEQVKHMFGFESYWVTVPFVGIVGKLGVVLFFVLSGFLITYLLCVEEKSFKKIDIKKFYLRRVVRIWPLYFLIVCVSLFVIPYLGFMAIPGYPKEVTQSNLWEKILLFAAFSPNLLLCVYGVVPFAAMTWSIGTEEQFYLIWPWILRTVKKNRMALMLVIVLLYLMVKFFLESHLAAIIPKSSVILAFWHTFPIDCMAIGGFYSLLLFNKSRWLKILFRMDLFCFSLVLVSGLMIFGIYIPYVHYEFYSVFFGVVVLNFAANDRLKKTLEHTVLNYLGSISYGLYMFHPIGIVLAIAVIQHFNIMSNWLLYPASLGISIALASASYRYFEGYFLKFKVRFSRIKSG